MGETLPGLGPGGTRPRGGTLRTGEGEARVCGRRDS